MQSARASSSRIRRIGGSSSSSVDIKKSQGSLPQLSYAQRLSFYTLPPVEEVGVDEFIQFASDRLTVLREIDTSRIRGLGAEEIENRVKASCMKHLPLHTNKRSDIRKDVISHFVLRLAFCTTPESRKWFLKQECELLRFRLTSDNTDIAKFLEENGMSETQVTRAEFQQYEQEIRACHPIKKQDKCSAIYYYKVRFTDVLNLVARRSTFLRGGYAYIYRDDLISVVQNNYRQHLSKELTKAYRAEAMIRKDERISAILNGLARGREQSMSQTYDANQRQVNPLQLEFLSRQSFPLCAQNMHRQLKRTHHLKHWARVQHGLFLKAVGLPLEGALEFWRTEFCKEVGMDTTTFDRKYAYNFRHLYGKEGKRCDWSPYGCGRIITQFKNPGEGEYHGCPYQTMDAEHLRIALEQTMRERPHVSAQQTLENWDEMRKGINEIVQLATDGHYQIACRKEFELRASPKVPDPDLIILHPNTYVDESLKLLSDGAVATLGDDKKTVPVPATPNTGGGDRVMSDVGTKSGVGEDEAGVAEKQSVSPPPPKRAREEGGESVGEPTAKIAKMEES